MEQILYLLRQYKPQFSYYYRLKQNVVVVVAVSNNCCTSDVPLVPPKTIFVGNQTARSLEFTSNRVRPQISL